MRGGRVCAIFTGSVIEVFVPDCKIQTWQVTGADILRFQSLLFISTHFSFTWVIKD